MSRLLPKDSESVGGKQHTGTYLGTAVCVSQESTCTHYVTKRSANLSQTVPLSTSAIVSLTVGVWVRRVFYFMPPADRYSRSRSPGADLYEFSNHRRLSCLQICEDRESTGDDVQIRLLGMSRYCELSDARQGFKDYPNRRASQLLSGYSARKRFGSRCHGDNT